VAIGNSALGDILLSWQATFCWHANRSLSGVHEIAGERSAALAGDPDTRSLTRPSAQISRPALLSGCSARARWSRGQ